MELTGKCKKDFEKWWERYAFENNLMESGQGESYPIGIWWFKQKLTFSMQYGVYVDFFDSVGIKIEIIYAVTHGWLLRIHGTSLQSNFFKTRHEARTEAIKKANEIHNNNS